jgi:hypothetical protein
LHPDDPQATTSQWPGHDPYVHSLLIVILLKQTVRQNHVQLDFASAV